MGWRQHEMIRRVAAPAVAILLGASCGAGASTAAGHRSTAAANRASAGSAAQVLGRQLARRSGIVVTPYEQQAFLELTFTTATATAARRPILERWTGNPTIHISGDPTAEDLAQVAESARRWSAITGHTMTVVAGSGNVDLRFVHRSDFGHVIDTGDVDPSAVGLT
ncbi:MAG: DUF2927 domain-containing protein, partial [Acidimicrobiia bacterium]